jgi:hypothetical protein
MVYITGDTHGELARFTEANFPLSLLGPEDILIIAGDFGYLFGLPTDEEKLDFLASLGFTIAFLDGNHECFPAIYAYPEEEWNGGRIHRIRPNLVHLMRGQVFTLEGMTLFTMGGGYSLDKAMRTPGRSWWPEELPSEEEYAEGLSNLSRHGNRVDFIISHAAPIETMEALCMAGKLSGLCYEEQRLNNYLQQVAETVTHRGYYFGHLHLDLGLWRNQKALWFRVYCLNTGALIWPSDV